MPNPAADAKKKCVCFHYLNLLYVTIIFIAYTNWSSPPLYVDILYNKSEGNDAFKNQDYPTAVAKYTEAIDLDPSNHVYSSNRRFVS